MIIHFDIENLPSNNNKKQEQKQNHQITVDVHDGPQMPTLR